MFQHIVLDDCSLRTEEAKTNTPMRYRTHVMFRPRAMMHINVAVINESSISESR